MFTRGATVLTHGHMIKLGYITLAMSWYSFPSAGGPEDTPLGCTVQRTNHRSDSWRRVWLRVVQSSSLQSHSIQFHPIAFSSNEWHLLICVFPWETGSFPIFSDLFGARTVPAITLCHGCVLPVSHAPDRFSRTASCMSTVGAW